MGLIVVGAVVVVLVLIVAVVGIRSQRADVVEERLGRYTEANTFITVTEDEKEKEKTSDIDSIKQMLAIS